VVSRVGCLEVRTRRVAVELPGAVVQTVKMSSGAAAVQIVYCSRRPI
jgi:hypothetical protein